MYCKKCGSKLSKTAKSCSECETIASAEDLNKRDQRKYAYRNAAGILYIIGGLNLIVYLVFYFLEIDFFGLDRNLIIGGLIFLVLGFLVQKRLMIALIVAIVIYGWDTWSGLILLFQGNLLAISFLFVHIIFLSAMVKSVGAIMVLKRK